MNNEEQKLAGQTERKLKQLAARIDVAMQFNAKMHDELLSIKRALEGANPVGEIFQHFAALWERRYRAKYTFNGAVDGNHIKRLLKVFDVTTLKARLSRYFADDEPFVLKNRHAFNVFVGRINSYTSPTSTDAVGFDPAEPVPGCTHRPPCGNDAEHTRRRMAEMRSA